MKIASAIKGPRSCGGFTLMELVVVMFILSIVTALVLPAFSTREDELRKETRKMASLLRYLNETAAMKKQTLELKFVFEDGTVSWEENGGTKSERFSALRSVELQSRGEVREGELTVFFGPMGLGEHMWVYLAAEGREFTVAFNPLSGRVKVT